MYVFCYLSLSSSFELPLSFPISFTLRCELFHQNSDILKMVHSCNNSPTLLTLYGLDLSDIYISRNIIEV